MAKLPDVQLGLVSQDPVEALAPELKQRLVAHYRVQEERDEDRVDASAATRSPV